MSRALATLAFLGLFQQPAWSGPERAGDPSSRAATELTPSPAAHAQNFLNSASTSALIQAWQSEPPTSLFAGQIALRLSRIMVHRRRFREARAWAIKAQLAPAILHDDARQILATTENRDHCVAGHLGALLPMTGEFGGVGKAALSGLQLALNGTGITLVTYDTVGKAARAYQGVYHLATHQKVCAIIGPVGHLESSSAADAAEDVNVPLISLASKGRLTHGRTFTFRYRLSFEDAGKAIAVYAMESLGIKDFAILSPQSLYGSRMRRAFWDTVEQRGGTIKAAQSYDPTRSDFHSAISGLIGRRHVNDVPIDPHWRRLNRKVPKRGLHVPPQVQFDGLFIPDGGARVQRLLPFLTYWDIEIRGVHQDMRALHHKYRGDMPRLVQVLGGAQFLSGAIDQQPKEADGAHFVDVYWRDTEAGQAFEDAWRRIHAATPSRMTAFGYAASRLVATVIMGQTSRAAVRRSLLGLGRFSSIFGQAEVDSGGVIRVEPRILKFDRYSGVQPVTKPGQPDR
ncbi:MAG: penicillin-binding protein activator [Myxococcota bacterium]|nr:penicillin-binding protein activator [Myxococcota bacterium]